MHAVPPVHSKTNPVSGTSTRKRYKPRGVTSYSGEELSWLGSISVPRTPISPRCGNGIMHEICRWVVSHAAFFAFAKIPYSCRESKSFSTLIIKIRLSFRSPSLPRLFFRRKSQFRAMVVVLPKARMPLAQEKSRRDRRPRLSGRAKLRAAGYCGTVHPHSAGGTWAWMKSAARL